MFPLFDKLVIKRGLNIEIFEVNDSFLFLKLGLALQFVLGLNSLGHVFEKFTFLIDSLSTGQIEVKILEQFVLFRDNKFEESFRLIRFPSPVHSALIASCHNILWRGFFIKTKVSPKLNPAGNLTRVN